MSQRQIHGNKTIFQFGEFHVDPLARTLRRGEETVTLNRRAFDVLLYLVQNPGRVLSREELLRNVWPDTFVDENSLAQSVSVLRRAIEEKPGDNSYLVTLPGRGYQFVSPVTVVAPESLSMVPDVTTAGGHPSRGLLIQRNTSRTSVITEERRTPGLVNKPKLAGAGAGRGFNRCRGIGYGLLRVDATSSESVADASSYCQFDRGVPCRPPFRRGFGFSGSSGRPEEGWLSTALAEMLSTELVAGEKLRLVSGEDIARTKLDLPFADTDSLSRNTLARLHKDLDSDLIVLGSYTALVEKSDTRIRLDVRLQDTAAGETLADVAVAGSEADLFDLVSQAGSQLREKLGVEAVSPVEAVSVRGSLPSNREAARLYSEGLARLRVMDSLAARDLLQQAVAADPKYPLAHSALASAWSRLGYMKKAQQEAREAYELSANLSREEKLVVEGRYREVDHQYERAIDVYRALFTLFPDNLDYGIELAGVEVRGGKGPQALATVESLRKLTPPASQDPRIDLREADAWTVVGDLRHRQQPLARAAEKAQAQGARLILAQAREMQCRLFRFFGQMQNAVSACREARDIFAAAGDQAGEARSLRAWADAIAQMDAPESVRLYQQAQAIFRKSGSEADLADVLNNLGNVYEAQGDPATAEKMLREALGIYRLLDDQFNLVSTIGNIGSDRIDQGDLPGALQLNQEQLRLGNPANPFPAYNIAHIRQLQGDLVGAKLGFEQALAIWQKAGDPDSAAYPIWSLGTLLFQGGDLLGARKNYEQALAARTAAGDKLTIAETQLSLADLSLEERRSPIEQEAPIRQVIEAFQKQKARDDETTAWSVLARALHAEGKAPAANEAMLHARSLAARSQNPEIRWNTAITAARIETAENAAGTLARKELSAIIAKSRQMGYQGIELDARLALAEIEMKQGQTAVGRAHLAAIESDAKAKGYHLIARKAALARG